MSGSDSNQDTSKNRGLNTVTHSALLNENLTLIKTQFQQPNAKSYKKNNKRGYGAVDAVAAPGHTETNPYLSAGLAGRSDMKRKKHILDINNFHTVPGGMSKQYELQREMGLKNKKEMEERRRIKRELREKEMEMVTNGELPDHLLNESAFLVTESTVAELIDQPWDAMYLNKDKTAVDSKYTSLDYHTLDLDDDSDLEDDDEEEDEQSRPSIRYVLHPVPVTKETLTLGGTKPTRQLNLTKKELKKLRRNKRKLDRQVTREKIKLGLEPKPETKVRMGNIMNVIQNNVNITDPTLFEKQVKEQVEERLHTHERMNQERHAEAQERQRELVKETNNTRKQLLQSDKKYFVHCLCFKISKLLNPKNRYKINMNSKQQRLQGCCLRLKDTGEAILLVQGSEKSCKFFEKLIMHRISWTEPFFDKELQQNVDMSDCKVELKWSGILESPLFKGHWFMKECHNVPHLLRTLDEFDCKQYWL